jgi:microcin C transport system substrate-binding protein
MFDTLMQRSWDELASEYALIADDVEVAPTGCRPRFTSTRPRASRTATRSPRPTSSIRSTRWRAPSVADRNAQFSIIKRAVVVDSHTIRFEFKRGARRGADRRRPAGVLAEVGQRADGTRPPFDQIANVPPIASGAYLIEQRRNDKQITRAQPALLGREPAVAARMFRFARVSFKLYLDSTRRSRRSRPAMSTRGWNTARRSGRARRQELPQRAVEEGRIPGRPRADAGLHDEPAQADVPDVRVRHALALAFDFDWMSRMMFYGQYRAPAASGRRARSRRPARRARGARAARTVPVELAAGRVFGPMIGSRRRARPARCART